MRLRTLLTAFVVFSTALCAGGEPASIRVHLDEPIGTINPLIYGHFTELTLSSYEGGVWSEMLVNRKLAEPEELERFPFPRSGSGAGWKPLSFDTKIVLHLDKRIYYSAPFSQRITLSEGGSGLAGISQEGSTPRGSSHPFQFKKGERYGVRLAIKQKNLSGPVMVALGTSPEEAVAAHSFDVMGDDWNLYGCVLSPSADGPEASFMVYIDSPGTVWVDSISLTPADRTINGFRRDVIELTNTVTPTAIRYPGGCFADDYHWEDGIGPMDMRPAVYNRAWKRYTTNDVGTAEFMEMCRLLRAEPYICVNYGTGTPEEAAAWVEYCNGGTNTKWGQLRAEHGYPEPFNVKYWNIGNELYLPTEFGATNGFEYGKGFREFAEAMRAVDPDIHLVAVGTFDQTRGVDPSSLPNPVMWQVMRYSKDWTKGLLEGAGEHVDSISIHYYEPSDVKEATSLEQVNKICMSVAENLAREIDELYVDISKYGPEDKHIPLALDEWANWVHNGPEPPPRDYIPKDIKGPEQISQFGSVETLRKALSEATIMNLKQQRPADFSVGSITLLYHPVMGEVAMRRDAAIVSPCGLMMGLYATQEQCQALKTEVNCDIFEIEPIGNRFAGLGEIQELSVSARVRPDNKTVDVFVVNRNLEEDVASTLECVAQSLKSEVAVATLNGEEIYDINTYDKPDRVSVQKSTAKADGNRLDYVFPAHSITRLTLQTN